MAKYYQEIALNEHCLYAWEIADIFGFYTQNNLPHKRFISALLKEANVPVYYFQTQKGLAKCYAFKDYYPLIQRIMIEVFSEKDYDKVIRKELFIKKQGTTFTVYLTNEKRNGLQYEDVATLVLKSMYFK